MRLAKDFTFTVTYDVELLNEIVLVHRLPRTGDQDGPKRKKSDLMFNCCVHKEEDKFILRRSFWDKRVKSYGKNWLFRNVAIPCEEKFRVATKEFMKHYLGGCHYQFDGESYSEEDPFSIVKSEGLNRVVCIDDFGWSNLLYQLDGDVLPRAIFFDYISGRINSANFEIVAIEEWMTMSKLTHLVTKGKAPKRKGKPERFSDVESVGIPGYNSDYTTGSEALEFSYIPTTKEFQSFIKVDQSYNREKKPSLDSDVALQVILKMIPKAFKKPEPVKTCDCDYDDNCYCY